MSQPPEDLVKAAKANAALQAMLERVRQMVVAEFLRRADEAKKR